MTRFKSVTEFREFRHVDKVRSPPLLVTSIFWLSTYNKDFGGGRTEFLTGGPEPFTPQLMEPKIGRFAAWTSAYENPHAVQEMLWGDRYALLFAITAHGGIGHKSIHDLREWSKHMEDDEEEGVSEAELLGASGNSTDSEPGRGANPWEINENVNEKDGEKAAMKEQIKSKGGY